jgi:hypothetical protein
MRMLKFAAMAIIIIIITATLCLAQENSPQSLTESFFQMLKDGKTSEAYDQLFAGSSIPQSKPQAVGMIKRQTASGLPTYGSILGHELIREEKYGTSIIRLVYVLKLEIAATVWEFYFYKPKSTWFFQNVLFNDQFKLLDARQ